MQIHRHGRMVMGRAGMRIPGIRGHEPATPRMVSEHGSRPWRRREPAGVIQIESAAYAAVHSIQKMYTKLLHCTELRPWPTNMLKCNSTKKKKRTHYVKEYVTGEDGKLSDHVDRRHAKTATKPMPHAARRTAHGGA